MRDFNDFLKSIDTDALGAEIDRITMLHPAMITAPGMSPENISAILTALYKQSVTVSAQITLAYLKQYHEWSEQAPGH